MGGKREGARYGERSYVWKKRKDKGKKFRKGRWIERRENRQRGRRNVQVEIQEKSTGRLKYRITKR